MSNPNYKPEGYHTITPYLIVKDADALQEFISQVFDATIEYTTRRDDGTIMHGSAVIGDSHIMFSQATEEYQPNPCMLYLYVEDVDVTYAKALNAGGESLREPTDEHYGDRSSGVKDSNGMQWWIATHQEKLSEEEMERRKAGQSK